MFYQAAREVRDVYRNMAAEQAFQARIMPGEHSWDARRILALDEFLGTICGSARCTAPSPNESLLGANDRCLPDWPFGALGVDALAEQLTGRRVADGVQLWDVFPPRIPPDAKLQDIADRGSTRAIFAQYEAFLRTP